MRLMNLQTRSMLIGGIMVLVAMVAIFIAAESLEQRATQPDDMYTPPEPPKPYAR